MKEPINDFHFDDYYESTSIRDNIVPFQANEHSEWDKSVNYASRNSVNNSNTSDNRRAQYRRSILRDNKNSNNFDNISKKSCRSRHECHSVDSPRTLPMCQRTSGTPSRECACSRSNHTTQRLSIRTPTTSTQYSRRSERPDLISEANRPRSIERRSSYDRPRRFNLENQSNYSHTGGMRSSRAPRHRLEDDVIVESPSSNQFRRIQRKNPEFSHSLNVIRDENSVSSGTRRIRRDFEPNCFGGRGCSKSFEGYSDVNDNDGYKSCSRRQVTYPRTTNRSNCGCGEHFESYERNSPCDQDVACLARTRPCPPPHQAANTCYSDYNYDSILSHRRLLSNSGDRNAGRRNYSYEDFHTNQSACGPTDNGGSFSPGQSDYKPRRYSQISPGCSSGHHDSCFNDFHDNCRSPGMDYGRSTSRYDNECVGPMNSTYPYNY